MPMLPDPTDEQLRAAFALCRSRRWPLSFEEAMSDPLRARLVRVCALGQMRKRMTGQRPAAPAKATTVQPTPWSRPGYVDCKRAAAGDRDD